MNAEPGGDLPELVVVGAGIAGLTMAARAAEGGLAVTVLEQGSDERYPCNSRYSGGILHIAYQDIASPPESLTAAVRQAMGADADDALAAAVAHRATQAREWITAAGARFVKASPTPWHRWTLAPPRPLRPGLDFPGSGPDRLLGTLVAKLQAAGGTLLRNHRAIAIDRLDRGFVVTAQTPHGTRRIETRAVAIADGGFQGDAELVGRHISARPERFVQRGAGTGQGFAVRVASTLGCGLSRMDRFYGHLQSRDALANPQLWPYPQIDATAAACIVVDASGRRFVDEGRGGVYIVNALAKRDDPAGCFAVLDESIWETAGRESLYPANPHLVSNGGTLLRARGARALADSAVIDADGLDDTLRDYNIAARGGRSALAALDVPRSGSPNPIDTETLIAIPLAPGITNTMGGVAVDANARALDANGAVIPGLYAIGASAGGLEGGENVGYVGGLMRGLTSGLAAADDALGASGKTAAPSTSVAPRAPAVPMLRFLARHGTTFAIVFATLAGALSAALAWPAAGWMALPIGVAVGAVVFVSAKAFAEMARIILDTLVPE